jgi:hypothetical protein
MARKGYKYHLTVADVAKIFDCFPDAVLTRSDRRETQWKSL